MAKLWKWDIALDFSLNISFTEKTETYQKRTWSWSNPKFQTATRTILEYQWNEWKLDECCWDIANLMKEYMIDYAPIDTSKHKDKIVLRDNIRVEQRGVWAYRVWPQWIPYALRRNFENKLHPEKRHYIEKTWNFHSDEYQKILNSYAEEIWADIIKRAIRWMSWWWADTNWWSWKKWLQNNGKFGFNTILR